MNFFQRLAIECDGICGTIDEYTDDSKVMNYLSKLQEAVAEANYDTIMYTLSGIDKWYEENIGAISSNEYVFNLESHQKNMQLIKEILSGLKKDECVLTASEIIDAKKADTVIFISHKSDDKKYGDALRNFIIGLGVKEKQLVYTSHPLHKIPLDESIYEYLRSHFNSTLFMIILWSDKYLESPACLNEMGAAWVTQTDYTNIYVPFKRTEEDNKNYSNPDADPKGMWRSGDVRSPNYRKTLRYTITAPNGNIIQPPTNGWRWSEESLRDKISTGEIKFKSDNSGIIRKIYLCDQPGRTPENLWEGQQFGTTRQAASLIKNLFDGVQVFDTPKPIELIKKMLEIATGQDSIVLDFFSGSATTAHAVMQLNAEDGGHRKFIMVQLPEKTDEKSEAYKFGYKYINEIGKERIRRAAKKIAEENPETKFDGGFRVLKCDSSNMKNVYYNPAEYEPSLFTSLEDNIKEDRTSEDLLFQVMLDLGVLLSSKIEETTIAGKRVFNVEDNYLIACFDDNVTEEVITEIAKQKPYYFVMRDSSMANDSVATNFEQIFAAYSPDTVRKVL